MTMRFATLALFLVVMASCGGGEEDAAPPSPAGETPEETWETLRAALLAGDWETAYDLIAPSVREEGEAAWRRAMTDPEVGLENRRYLARLLASEVSVFDGPEGGEEGGEIIVSGTPEEVAANSSSHTGRALREVL